MQDVLKTIDANTKLRELDAEELAAGVNVMQHCVGLKAGESVLVVTDRGLLNVEAAIFFESAKKFASEVRLVEMPMASEHAQEPPRAVAKMMKEIDVAFLVTTFSLSHSKARKEACNAGARIVSMPGITKEMILRTLTIDYRKIAGFTRKITDILTRGKKVVVMSDGGTKLEISIDNRKAIADGGLFLDKGDFGNLPAGEAFIAPLEGVSRGRIVFDGCFADVELDEPIVAIVERGMAVHIKGGRAAEELERKIEKIGKLGYNIAEFGIGTNRKAKLSGNLLEVEKVYGTCHFALGNNATFGGKVDVPFHSDGVVLKPTIEVDGVRIVSRGVFSEEEI